MASEDPTTQPIRQPVMLKNFEVDPNSSATSLRTGYLQHDGAI